MIFEKSQPLWSVKIFDLEILDMDQEKELQC